MLSRLLQLFSRRRILQGTDGILVKQADLGKSAWVIGRDLLLFKRMDLQSVAKSDRQGALAIMLAKWNPHAQVGGYLVWGQDHALVWIFDQRHCSEQAAESGLEWGKGPAIVPESLLYPPMEDNGCRLIKALNGYEGQCWQAGGLAASHWWPDQPTLEQWRRFQRSAGEPGGAQTLPETLTPGLAATPWGKGGVLGSGRMRHLAVEFYLWWATIGLFCLVVGWQSGDLWHRHLDQQAVEAEIDSLSERIGDLLDARTRALDARQRIEQYAQMMDRVGVLELEYRVSRLLTEQFGQSRIVAWRYEQDRLELTLQGGTPEPSRLVKAFENSPLLSRLRVEPGKRPGQLRLSAQVGRSEDAAAGRASSGGAS